MSQEWGREEYAGEWPSSKPVWSLSALVVAVLAVGAIGTYRYARECTPLERHYLPAYVGERGGRGVAERWLVHAPGGVTRRGSRLALDEEVVPMTTASREKTEEAVKRGAVRLAWQRGRYENAKLHAYLGHWVYRDQTLTDLARPKQLHGRAGAFDAGDRGPVAT